MRVNNLFLVLLIVAIMACVWSEAEGQRLAWRRACQPRYVLLNRRWVPRRICWSRLVRVPVRPYSRILVEGRNPVVPVASYSAAPTLTSTSALNSTAANVSSPAPTMANTTMASQPATSSIVPAPITNNTPELRANMTERVETMSSTVPTTATPMASISTRAMTESSPATPPSPSSTTTIMASTEAPTVTSTTAEMSSTQAAPVSEVTSPESSGSAPAAEVPLAMTNAAPEAAASTNPDQSGVNYVENGLPAQEENNNGVGDSSEEHVPTPSPIIYEQPRENKLQPTTIPSGHGQPYEENLEPE